MNQKLIAELTSISALLDAPNSISIIPPGQITTNISNLYYQRPKKKFPFKITRNKKQTKIGFINPIDNKQSEKVVGKGDKTMNPPNVFKDVKALKNMLMMKDIKKL